MLLLRSVHLICPPGDLQGHPEDFTTTHHMKEKYMAENAEHTKALGEATRAADKRLREAHQDEWNGYKSEETAARGLDWKPRMTPEQKAEQEFERLLRDHPHLASKI